MFEDQKKRENMEIIEIFI